MIAVRMDFYPFVGAPHLGDERAARQRSHDLRIRRRSGAQFCGMNCNKPRGRGAFWWTWADPSNGQRGRDRCRPKALRDKGFEPRIQKNNHDRNSCRDQGLAKEVSRRLRFDWRFVRV